MTRIRNLLLVTIIIVLCDCTISKRQFRSKRSGRDYILHSCTATAHLVRKNRNHAITGDILRNTSNSEFPFSLLKRNSKYQSPTKSEAVNRTREEKGKIKSPDKRHYGRRIEDHLYQNGLSQMNLKDTPLKTVRIKSIHKNRPPTFMKKDPLPELERYTPGRKTKTASSVVVVQSLH